MTATRYSADRVLQDINAARQKLLAEHGGMEGLAAYIREKEKTSSAEFRSPKKTEGKPKRSRPKRTRD